MPPPPQVLNKLAHSVFVYSQTSVYTGWSKVKPNDNHNVIEITITPSFQNNRTLSHRKAHHSSSLQNSLLGKLLISQKQILRCLNSNGHSSFLKLGISNACKMRCLEEKLSNKRPRCRCNIPFPSS